MSHNHPFSSIKTEDKILAEHSSLMALFSSLYLKGSIELSTLSLNLRMAREQLLAQGQPAAASHIEGLYNKLLKLREAEEHLRDND